MHDIPQQGEIQRVNTQQKKSDPEPTGNGIIPFQTYKYSHYRTEKDQQIPSPQLHLFRGIPTNPAFRIPEYRKEPQRDKQVKHSHHVCRVIKSREPLLSGQQETTCYQQSPESHVTLRVIQSQKMIAPVTQIPCLGPVPRSQRQQGKHPHLHRQEVKAQHGINHRRQ